MTHSEEWQFTVRFENGDSQEMGRSMDLQAMLETFITGLVAAFAEEEPATLRLAEAASGRIALEAVVWPMGVG